MLYFYPGPSKLYPQVRNYLADAYDSGILSMNHRSADFVSIVQSAVMLLKTKLHIPQDYSVFFVSSATESWEIIAQSLVKKGSLHIFNGAFGQKWAEYSHKIHQKSSFFPYSLQEELDISKVANDATFEVICLTHNETSNGTQLDRQTIRAISEKYRDKIIAVDATSSMAGIELEWENADVWFASVQKCFGMPAGLGLMVCSPKALAAAQQINDRKYYNSLLFLAENMQHFQTNYTPNVLNIYVLNQVLSQIDDIKIIGERTERNAKNWYHFLEKHGFDVLVKNPKVRSSTVIAIQDEETFIRNIKEKAKQAGMILGNGYGIWKNTTFRIANFPAITDEEIAQLRVFLQSI
ncbi:MAG: alanine--glyoxylate aminotransferase family protein [Cytophagales bacterium]|nr:MAG: alanine--glyoxylate aminotransferase family protein [Cytophagales bacterium]